MIQKPTCGLEGKDPGRKLQAWIMRIQIQNTRCPQEVTFSKVFQYFLVVLLLLFVHLLTLSYLLLLASDQDTQAPAVP